jgi:predicted dehydrogenase
MVLAVRVLQAGMGGWGRNWAGEIVPEVEEIEPAGYVDTDPESLARVQKSLGVPAERCFPSLEEGLEATDPEAVLVTASLPGHVPLVRAALEADKHVLVEKPFAPTLAEGQELVRIAAERGLALMVSQNYRFFPAVQAAAGLVRGEELGPVGAVSLDFRRWSKAGPNGRHWHHTVPHPLLVDMSIHHFDLMRAVLDKEPREVYCKTWNPPWSDFDGPAAGVATVVFEDDAVVNYQGSWVSPGPTTPWAGEWRMECEGGEISWTSRAGGEDRIGGERVAVRPFGEDTRRIEFPELPYAGRAGSLFAFSEAIRTGQEPESSARDNLRSLGLMAAAVESAASGLPVLVPDLP